MDVTGEDCLDIGASTGGFTDCLLQAGAARVCALDVGYGQIDLAAARGFPRDRHGAHEHPRVACSALPFTPSFLACDVSFIGLGRRCRPRSRAPRRAGARSRS